MPNENVDMNLSSMQYILDVEIKKEFGEVGKATLTTNDKPFVLVGIRHQIIWDGVNTSADQKQDGLYRIDWSLFSTQRFFKGPKPMANAAFGSPKYGNWANLMSPITLEKSQTLYVAVQNMYRGDRNEDWEVQIIFDGLEELK